MAKHDPTLQEFIAMWTLRGLDPEEFDMERLHLAWCSLQRLMQRMQPSHQPMSQKNAEAGNEIHAQPVGTLPQSIFDATRLVKRGDT